MICRLIWLSGSSTFFVVNWTVRKGLKFRISGFSRTVFPSPIIQTQSRRSFGATPSLALPVHHTKLGIDLIQKLVTISGFESTTSSNQVPEPFQSMYNHYLWTSWSWLVLSFWAPWKNLEITFYYLESHQTMLFLHFLMLPVKNI